MSAPAASGSSVAGRPLLAFLTCATIWGSTFLAIRLGNDTLPPLWGASLRLGLAAVLLTTLVRVTGRITSPAQFGDVIVATRNGEPVRVRDVARVEDGSPDERSLALLASGKLLP